MRQQVNHFTWGKVLTCLFIIFFVKFTNEFLKYISHTEVRQSPELIAIWILRFKWAQVDVWRYKFLQYIRQYIFACHVADLSKQIKAVDDLFNVVTKA